MTTSQVHLSSFLMYINVKQGDTMGLQERSSVFIQNRTEQNRTDIISGSDTACCAIFFHTIWIIHCEEDTFMFDGENHIKSRGTDTCEDAIRHRAVEDEIKALFQYAAVSRYEHVSCLNI